MAQATHKKVNNRPISLHMMRGMREGAMFVLVAIGLYLLMALLTYNPQDPGWSYTGSGTSTTNLGGVAGAWFADAFFYVFGYLAYLAPIAVIYSGWLINRGQSPSGQIEYGDIGMRWVGFAVTLAAGCGLATLQFGAGSLPLNAGGIVGDLVGHGLERAFNFVGATLLMLALFLAGITLFTGLSWLALIDLTGRGGLALYRETLGRVSDALDQWRTIRAQKAAAKATQKVQPKLAKRKALRIEPVLGETKTESKPKPLVERESQPIPLFVPTASDAELPPFSLLDSPLPGQGGYSEAKLQDISRQVEAKLLDFGIAAEVVAVQPGPVITRFELHPAPGVKVSRITSLAKDLARALSVISVRIVEVIPGKPVVGLEIPNERREIVSLSEIIHAPTYQNSGSALTLALGKDIGGLPVAVDLARMPHLLVAGTTGAGKSVAINAMLLSLLYKGLPTDVRLILIDPKMLELSVYDGIPHLLAPVVTDMKEAANALRWSVAEMERRYKLMSCLGVRNIAGFNKKIKDAIGMGEPITDPLFDRNKQLDPEEAPAPALETLPLIVIVIDEFADMMIVVGKKVEELIARLAQKARAAGIHLVLATQRPSVDVITGLIKANIPVRIAFQVSSKIDSRTIIDQMGAEQLLGHGDMLYLPLGHAVPERVHGAFVQDHEVHKVVGFLKNKGKPDYIEAVLQEPDSSQNSVPGLEPLTDAGGESDPLYDEAVAIVIETRKASISYVQRRLKIGYNRAARMIEEMEQAGVVSAVQANGGREVLAPPPPPRD